MAKTYRILPGASFRRDDGSLATGGDHIELEDDVADRWKGSVEEVVTESAGAASGDQPAHAD